MTEKQSVEDAIKQLVLANADGEIKSLVYVMINHENEPEMQIAIAPGTMYSAITGLELLRLHLITKLMTDGGKQPKERE